MTDTTVERSFIRDRLEPSSNAVFVVGRWLHDGGRDIEIPALRKTRQDDGDLFVLNPRKRIEVKHLKAQFSSPDDWPFSEVFVSRREIVDRIWEQVEAWISVSADLRYAAIISPDTRIRWYHIRKFNSEVGREQDYTACPTNLVNFRKIANRSTNGR